MTDKDEAKTDKPTSGDPVNGPVKEPAPVDKASTDAAQEAGTLPDQHNAQPGDPVVVAHKKGLFGSSLGLDTSGFGGLNRAVLFPGEASRPYGSWFDQVADDLAGSLSHSGGDYDAAISRVVVDRDELTFFVDRHHLLTVARALRDEPSLRFDTCLGVFGAHYPEETGAELHAIYLLRSVTNNSRVIRLEVTCPEGDAHIPSLVDLYPANNWHERETWDMFGIEFDGHPALTRILMPDDWPGHPQRKDYPLGGIPVEYKGATVPPADERRSYS